MYLVSRHLSTTGPSTVTTSNTRRTRDTRANRKNIHGYSSCYIYIYLYMYSKSLSTLSCRTEPCIKLNVEFGSSVDQYLHSLLSSKISSLFKYSVIVSQHSLGKLTRHQKLSRLLNPSFRIILQTTTNNNIKYIYIFQTKKSVRKEK